MSNGVSSDQPTPRLCHIIQWKHFDGYGFNLHAEKGKPGQFIGKVDEGSPAEAAGLKQGDKIIEVNGTNIASENHKQVVLRIKAVPNETKLLVVDAEADKYYKANYITIDGSLPEVKYMKTPMPEEDVNVDGKKSVHEDNNGGTKTPTLDMNTDKNSRSSTSTTPSSDRKNGDGYSPEPPIESADENFESSLKTSDNNKEAVEDQGDNGVNSSINLSMTAKELRAKLASRKKYDPKKDSMDFKKKFEIIHSL